jgi:NADH-quinone oxidoreductase subunit F
MSGLYPVVGEDGVLINFERGAGSWSLDSYLGRNGYKILEAIVGGDMTPEQLTQEVKDSGLRGRGGAGFPTGLKWGFLGKSRPAYLVVNADESEPGTFKDRLILEENPHQLIEGSILSCYALGAEHCYVYVRGEFGLPMKRLMDAVDEAYAAGYLGKPLFGSDFACEITVHSGAGAYICGEETGLLESLEGKKGQPRIKPPFPAVIGAYGCPTIVNNVESIASVVAIAEMGGKGYRAWGTERSAGTKLFSVSGHIKKPGVYEVPLGYPFRDFLHDECGGMMDGADGSPLGLKALIIGGSSVPVVDAETAMKIHMDYESCEEHGTMLGSGGVIVMAEGTCMVRSLLNLMHFYHHESCGQCTPCREGTGWLHRAVKRIEDGRGSMADIDEIVRIADNMEGKTICTLADAAAWPVQSHVKVFRAEFEEHVRLGRCPFGGRFPDYIGVDDRSSNGASA